MLVNNARNNTFQSLSSILSFTELQIWGDCTADMLMMQAL